MDNWWEQDEVVQPAKSGGQTGGGVNAETRGQAAAKVAAIRTMRPQLDEVERIYRDNFLSPNRIDQLKEYLPWTSAASKLRAASQGLVLLGRQATRVPGSGSDTDRELQVLLDAIAGAQFDRDEGNLQRFAQTRRILDDMERQYAPVAGEAIPAPAPAAPPTAPAAGPKRIKVDRMGRPVK